MATTYYNDIQKLYVAYFNRPADAAGLAYYEGVLEAAKGSATVMAQISADFAKSTEYTAAFSGKTSAQIVDIIYTNIFGHAADAAGNKFYADNLDAKKVTLADVVTEVAKGAQGSDLTAYNNKLAAAAAFSAAVDTDAEKKGYSGDAANKVAKAFLAGVTTDVSLAVATSPVELNKAVANAVFAGTPFTVSGALASSAAAQTAYDKFVASVDVDGDPDTDTVDTDIGAAYTAAVHNVALKLDAGVQALFENTTTTDAVRDALVGAQQAVLAADLAAKQTLLSNTTTEVSKVAGLSAAVTTLAAATTAESSANKALTAANADLAAKEAAFGVTNAGTVKVVTDATTGDKTLVLDITDATKTDVTLATINAAGKATVAANLDTTKYAGATDIIASFNAQLTASTNVTKAHNVTLAAQAEVNHLDVDTVTVFGTTGKTEAQLLNDVTTAINTYADAHANTVTKVAAGSTATEAQITTALAVMQANDTAASTEYESFVTLSGNYRAAAASNPLTSKQGTQTTDVNNATKAISDLTKLVVKMDAAEANVNTLAGLKATLDASHDLLEAKGFHVNETTIGTAASDVFTVADMSAGDTATISLFNLQGTDSVFIGSGYKLVQGSTHDVKGDNAALEVFVSSNASGDAVLEIETSAFGSSASTAEVITITLTGVDATTLHLNNGIISAGTLA
jgi:hypothetical protein